MTEITIEIHKLQEIAKLLNSIAELIDRNHKISGDLRKTLLLKILEIKLIIDENYAKGDKG